jgi:uncharacterized protein YqjF (DUF2071 family)
VSAPRLLAMVWSDICTVHWRVDATRLATLLPPGLTLDRYKGDAWLSVVPFRMSGIHLRFAPVLPGFASVPEINLRTYVRADATPGIFFFSLDAASPLMVRSARLATGLPYRDARMKLSSFGTKIRIESERTARDVVPGVFRAQYEPRGTPYGAAPGSLEAFLHERYHFFLQRGGRLWSGEVEHEPWLLRSAHIEVEANTLGTIANEALATPPERCYFTAKLNVRAGAVRPFYHQF